MQLFYVSHDLDDIKIDLFLKKIIFFCFFLCIYLCNFIICTSLKYWLRRVLCEVNYYTYYDITTCDLPAASSYSLITRSVYYESITIADH